MRSSSFEVCFIQHIFSRSTLNVLASVDLFFICSSFSALLLLGFDDFPRQALGITSYSSLLADRADVDLKSMVAGSAAEEQTSKFLKFTLEQRTFCRHTPIVIEEDDVEEVGEPDLAPMASESTYSVKAKGTPQMSVEEIKRRASKRKNPSLAQFTSDATSFPLSPRKATNFTSMDTPKVEGEVNLSFPAGFLSRGEGSSIARADAEKLLFPAPRRQLSALPPGQVCDEGSSFLLLALQHSLMMRQTVSDLELEVAALKKKIKDTTVAREKAEEQASRSERLLSEKDAEWKKLKEKLALLEEETKDAESFVVMKTRAQLFKQFLEGKSATWDAKRELDFYLSNIGDATDLVFGAEERKDGDAIRDIGVSTTNSIFAADLLVETADDGGADA